MAGNLKLVGSVGIKVRPDSRGFGRAAKRQVEEEMANKEVDLPVDAELTEESKRRLKRDSKKAVEEADKEAGDIEIDVVLDKRGFDSAIARVEEKLREVENGKTKVKLGTDKDSLKELKEDLKDLQRGSQLKLKYADDPEGRREAARKIDAFIREMSEKEIEFTFDKDSLEAEKKKLLDGLADDKPTKVKTIISYDRDRESLEAALKKVDDRLREMKAVKVPIDWDSREDIEKWKKEFERRLTKYPLKLKVRNDQDSWAELIEDLEKRKRALEKKVRFTVEPDEAKSAAGMQRAIERARAQAKASPIHVEVEYDNDLASMDRAIAKLREKLKTFSKHRVVINAEMNEEQIRAKLAELHAERHSLGLRFDVDDNIAGIEAARERIKQELQRRIPKLRYDVGLNTEELQRELMAVDAELLRRRKLKVALEGIEAARLRLAALARDRVATILIKTRDLTAFSFAKLTGLRAAARWTEEFGRALGSLDRNLPIVAAITLAITQLTSSVLALGSNLFVLGQGLAQIGQLGLLGPALIGGLATSMIVWLGVFKDLGAAINGDEKAFKKLTASGQEAVMRIRPLFQDLREGMSKNFWEGASDGLLRFTKEALPAFSDGLKQIARVYGKGFGGVLDSFNDFSKRGGIATQFNFLAAGIELANKGAADFWNALNTLGAIGSRVFPRMGQAFTNMSEKFDNWVQRITTDGTLGHWVDRGIRNLKDLWQVLVNTGQVWSNFAQAAEAAGGATLGKLARGLQQLEDATAGYRFQRNMQNVFEGAHNAMRIFGQGLGDIAPQMDQFSVTLKNLLTNAATAFGSLAKTLGDVLGNAAVDNGFKAFMDGLDSMFRSLRPSASAVAGIIGTLGEVLGAVATDAGPLFAELFKQLNSVFREAFVQLKPFIPELTELGKEVVSTLGPALVNLASSVVPMVGRAFEAVSPLIIAASDGIKALSEAVKDSNAEMQKMSNGKFDWADAFGTGAGVGITDGLFGRDQSDKWTKAKKQAEDQWQGFANWASDAAHTALSTIHFYDLFPGLEKEYQKQLQERIAKANGEVAKNLPKLNEDMLDGTSGLNAGVQAWADSANKAASRLLEAERIVKILGDSSRDAASKVDAFNASLKMLNGDKVSERDALARQVTNMNRFKQEAAALRPVLDKVKDSLVGPDGLLNIGSGNVGIIGLRDTMRSAATDVKVTAQATYDAAIKNNATVKDSVKAALDAVKAGHGNLEEIAKAAGVDVKLLESEWDTFFGKDWVLAATFTGTTDKFELAAQLAKEKGLEFDGEEFWGYLMADGNPANNTTDEIRAHMDDWANKQYKAKLEALPDPARTVLEQLLDSVDQQWRHGDFEATMRAAQNIPGLPGVIMQLLNSRGPYDATFWAKLDQASAAAVTAALRAIAAEQHIATVVVKYAEEGGRPGTAGGGLRYVNADGGIYARGARVFANGGFSFENHVAQIARPGVIPRVWAEAETGGEAYIPYALHKRQRSTQILTRVASDFGYQLVRRYADGGSTASSTSYSAPVTIGTLVTNDPDRAVSVLQTRRRDAMAVHQIKPF